MGRRSKPAHRQQQWRAEASSSWLTTPAAAGVVVALAFGSALLLGFERESPRLDDRAALATAEDLLESVSERASALRARGSFFGQAYSELLPSASRAETLLLGMLKPDPQVLLSSHRIVAHTAMSAGHLEASFAAYTRSALAEYDPARNIVDDPHERHADGRYSFPFTQRARLQHDLEQIEYLLELQGGGTAQADSLPSRQLLEQSRESYQSVLQQIGLSPPEHAAETLSASDRATAVAMADMLKLSAAQWDAIKPWYNRAHVIPHLPRQSTAVLAVSDTDAEATEEAYLRSNPSLVVVDNLLTDSALEALRDFAARATVWFDTKPGYVGAYLSSGWGTDLMAQITEEIRARFPRIICQHQLIEAWAYKYDPHIAAGIQTHADEAAVNLNLWITPTEASLNPAGAGLTLFTVKPPKDWTYMDYNGARGLERIERLLDAHDRANVTVPFKENRAVLFDSHLFHVSGAGAPGFKGGIKNRRINLTFLFGLKGEPCKTR